MSKTYIHYGHDEFDKTLFNRNMHNRLYNKPIGGLWASPVDAEFGWKDWCERENFRECNEEDSFKFKLSYKAKVLTISCLDDVKKLYKDESIVLTDLMLMFCYRVDFEWLSNQYDAIELELSKDYRLYDALYGWDCDSILILNPDIIEEV